MLVEGICFLLFLTPRTAVTCRLVSKRIIMGLCEWLLILPLGALHWLEARGCDSHSL